MFRKLLPLLLIVLLGLTVVACNSDDKPEGRVDWKTAVSILNEGEVEEVHQTHSLEVTMFLKDGRVIETTEPAIDDIIKAIDACGAPCADIAIATE